MSCFVIKLGSSLVADASGELRAEQLARICGEAAELYETGADVVIVTSGAIARGMRIMELPMRPTHIDELQAASAVGQGKLYRVYDELLRERGVTSAQVLLTFFDMSARTHYLNARQTLRKLLDWRVLPVINENDTTTTDEISFGDNDFLAAQVAVLLGADAARAADRHRRAVHRGPADRADAPSSWTRSRTTACSTASRSGTARRRSDPAACARRSSPPRWRPRPGSRR